MNGLTILLEPTDQNVSLEVDPVQFRTVLTNLFENARKYVDRNDKQVVVSYEVVEEQFILSIIDNGSGVSERIWKTCLNFSIAMTAQEPTRAKAMA